MKKLIFNFYGFVSFAFLLLTFSMSGCVFSPLCPVVEYNPVRYETDVNCPDESKLKTKIFYGPHPLGGSGRFKITISALSGGVEPPIILFLDSGNTESSVTTVLSKKIVYEIETFIENPTACAEASKTFIQHPLPSPPNYLINPCGGNPVNLNY